MFENWIAREPLRKGVNHIHTEIKFFFSKNKKQGGNPYGNILIPNFLLNISNINFGDKVRLLSDPEDDRKVLITKSSDDNGYKVCSQNKTKLYGKISFTFWVGVDVVQKEEYRTHAIEHQMTDAGILVKI